MEGPALAMTEAARRSTAEFDSPFDAEPEARGDTLYSQRDAHSEPAGDRTHAFECERPNGGREPSVAYLVSRYPAVSHTFIRREIAELRRRGLRIDTFSLRREPREALRYEEDKREQDATFYILPASPAGTASALFSTLRRPLRWLRTLYTALSLRPPGIRLLLWGCFYFAEAMILVRELEKRETAHLHSHFADSGSFVGLLACRYLGLGWSVTLHGASDFDNPGLRRLDRKIAIADFVACVSDYGRAQAMRASAPPHWGNLCVARCGLDLSNLAAAPFRRQPLRLHVLCVARLSPEKALPGLIEAFAAAVDSGLDAELCLVGEGPERERIEDHIAALGLGDRCRLTGALGEAEVMKEYAEADVFALPSFMEGLPVVLMEAMATGLPVIAPRLTGIPELVIDEETGLLFTPGRWDQLATALTRLGDSGLVSAGSASSDETRGERLRRTLGIAARQKIQGEYDIRTAVDPIYQRLSARLDEVVSAGPSKGSRRNG